MLITAGVSFHPVNAVLQSQKWEIDKDSEKLICQVEYYLTRKLCVYSGRLLQGPLRWPP